MHVGIDPDIKEADKVKLDQLFHAEGKSRPNVHWFSIAMKGPGAPERSVGEFVWVDDVRHLVLPLWLINVSNFRLQYADIKTQILDPKPEPLNPCFARTHTPCYRLQYDDIR